MEELVLSCRHAWCCFGNVYAACAFVYMVFLGGSFIGIVFYLMFVEYEFVNDKIEKVNVKCLKILKKS